MKGVQPIIMDEFCNKKSLSHCNRHATDDLFEKNGMKARQLYRYTKSMYDFLVSFNYNLSKKMHLLQSIYRLLYNSNITRNPQFKGSY